VIIHVLQSELLLQRYGKKKLYGPIWNFWKVTRGIFGNIFENQGPSWKFLGTVA
jgi:hypothetical protein